MLQCMKRHVIPKQFFVPTSAAEAGRGVLDLREWHTSEHVIAESDDRLLVCY